MVLPILSRDDLGFASRLYEPIPAARQLLDRELDPPGCPWEEADVLEHDQRRHRHRSERRARLGDRPRHVHHGGTPLLSQSLQLPAARDGHERCTRLERLSGGFDGLFGVTGERHREHERLSSDEIGQLVRFDDRDRYREERTCDRDEDVASDTASAHAEDDHLLHVLAVWQPVEAAARSDRRCNLLG